MCWFQGTRLPWGPRRPFCFVQAWLGGRFSRGSNKALVDRKWFAHISKVERAGRAAPNERRAAEYVPQEKVEAFTNLSQSHL
jgi:uncharacterized membrane protein YbaN (DUF454 family)